MTHLHCRKLLAVLFALVCLPAFLAAQTEDDVTERIRSFDSLITLNADGSMEVRESIEVQAAGDRIVHGLYRDFPTRYLDRLGNTVTVMFEIVAVERDGHSEHYKTESISDGITIYFGDKNKEISPGIYGYVFRYKTSCQLGFFKDHDELFCDVTGVGWIFPIDVATAKVMLPPQVYNFVTGVYAYTGAEFGPGKPATAG